MTRSHCSRANLIKINLADTIFDSEKEESLNTINCTISKAILLLMQLWVKRVHTIRMHQKGREDSEVKEIMIVKIMNLLN